MTVPKFPAFAGRTAQITGSVFEKFRPKMEAQGDDLVKLHIGDAFAPPPYHIPVERAFTEGHPGFNRYCDTFGIAPLREALAEKVRADNGLNAGPDHILVTAGCTNALSVAVQALVDPGEDVLLLSPYWPFSRGMVAMAGANPVEVPLYAQLYAEPSLDVRDQIERFLTPRTVMLYLNSPNNPSGKVLTRAQLEHVAAVCRDHDLWLVSDEAYDGMTFDGREHVSPGSFAGMFERTLSMFTFSKVFMFSGLRIGYVVSSRPAVEALNKVMVHQLYSPSTIAQQMMVEPVRTRERWSSDFVRLTEGLRDMFVERLTASPPVPEGAYYFFFSLSPYLRGRRYWDVFDACLEAGVSVAPGGDFGRGYEDYIRICFAGEPPDRLETAIERLNGLLGVA
jgi:aspartate/methionine/tyrosine aminotransferase